MAYKTIECPILPYHSSHYKIRIRGIGGFKLAVFTPHASYSLIREDMIQRDNVFRTLGEGTMRLNGVVTPYSLADAWITIGDKSASASVLCEIRILGPSNPHFGLNHNFSAEIAFQNLKPEGVHILEICAGGALEREKAFLTIVSDLLT